MVEVPDADVVFAGDLVEEGAPPVFNDAFSLDWPSTLDRLAGEVTGIQPAELPLLPEFADVALARAFRQLRGDPPNESPDELRRRLNVS